MISSDVAQELGLKGRKEVVFVSTLLQQEDEEFEVVQFKLQSAGGEEVITVEEDLYQRSSILQKCLPEDIDRKSDPHLVNIEITEVKLRKVSVLIEQDVSEAHEVFEV